MTLIDTRAAQTTINAWAERKEWRGPKAGFVIDCDAEGNVLPDAKPRYKRTFGDEIALITSELSEALEAYRDDVDITRVWFAVDMSKAQDYIEAYGKKEIVGAHADQVFKALDKFVRTHQMRSLHNGNPGEEMTDKEWRLLSDAGIAKPEGVPTELADAVIRILDTCEVAGIDLGFEIERKMAYNETRAIRHGGRAL